MVYKDYHYTLSIRITHARNNLQTALGNKMHKR